MSDFSHEAQAVCPKCRSRFSIDDSPGGCPECAAPDTTRHDVTISIIVTWDEDRFGNIDNAPNVDIAVTGASAVYKIDMSVRRSIVEAVADKLELEEEDDGE